LKSRITTWNNEDIEHNIKNGYTENQKTKVEINEIDKASIGMEIEEWSSTKNQIEKDVHYTDLKVNCARSKRHLRRNHYKHGLVVITDVEGTIFKQWRRLM